MKNLNTRSFIATLFAATLVAACGGGGSSPAPVAAAPIPVGPAALTIIDTRVGTGAVVVSGSSITVHYTGWLYNATAANFQGAQFDSSVGRTPFPLRIGVGQVIPGWDQGVVGMRVGGKRTLLIPSSLGYGATGNGPIPPNTGLVFDIELISMP